MTGLAVSHFPLPQASLALQGPLSRSRGGGGRLGPTARTARAGCGEICPRRGDRDRISDFCTLFSPFPEPPAGHRRRPPRITAGQRLAPVRPPTEAVRKSPKSCPDLPLGRDSYPAPAARACCLRPPRHLRPRPPPPRSGPPPYLPSWCGQRGKARSAALLLISLVLKNRLDDADEMHDVFSERLGVADAVRC